MIHPILHNSYPELPLSVNNTDWRSSQDVKEAACAVVIFEKADELSPEYHQISVAKTENTMHRCDETGFNSVSKKGNFDLSVNDSLRIHGKEYKINNFDLTMKDSKFLIYVLVNEV